MLHIIHENHQWLAPLRATLSTRGVAFDEWFMDRGVVDPFAEAPPGVFFNKMSASSFTRDHRHAPDYTAALLCHLEACGRRVVNGSNALRLELSKVEQYVRLRRAGIAVPRTVAAFGTESIAEAAKDFGTPFILKPNRGGKGIGVQLFRSQHMLADYLRGENQASSCDDIMLLQEYIEAPTPTITRLEFIGGKLVYAVAVDTSQGFELCPAEACAVNAPVQAGETCAITADDGLFRIVRDFTHPVIGQLEAFLQQQKIDVAGVEFITDRSGRAFVYDLNMNTNYNPEAEAKAGLCAMETLVDFLTREARGAEQTPPDPKPAPALSYTEFG